MTNYFEIGKIVNTQGIKGEIRVVPTTDNAARFGLLKSIIIRMNDGTIEHALERFWFHKGFVILKLAGINDINAAEKLRGGVIVIPPELALPLSEDEYYVRDLLDMEITTVDGEKLGVITDVLQTGANDVFVVKRIKGKDLLIPHIKRCVKNVDVTDKRMTVELLEGLLEL